MTPRRGAGALDPLSPFTAVLPVLVVVALSPGHETPALVLITALALLVLADPRRGPVIALTIAAVSCVVGASLSASAPVERVGASPVVLSVGSLEIQHLQALAGLRLGTKLGAFLSLCTLTGLLARPEDLLRALVTHLHVPYRLAYAGVAAVGFRVRLATEYRVVREAHALRGTRAPLPALRPLVRAWTAAPTLTAGAVRHAERVATSMDARGFGAYPDRTERTRATWRPRDTVVVLAGWALAEVLATGLSRHGVALRNL